MYGNSNIDVLGKLHIWTKSIFKIIAEVVLDIICMAFHETKILHILETL